MEPPRRPPWLQAQSQAPQASTAHPRPRSAPACGHADDRVTSIKMSDVAGCQGSFSLWSITSGGRELKRRHCVACRWYSEYLYREGVGEQAVSIGGDGEVIRATLLALLAQDGVDTFGLVVKDDDGQQGGPDGRLSYVLPRHHLPAFTIES